MKDEDQLVPVSGVLKTAALAEVDYAIAFPSGWQKLALNGLLHPVQLHDESMRKFEAS